MAAVADIFRQAAEILRADPRRSGNIVQLEDAVEVLLAGDIHGNRNWLTRIINAAHVESQDSRRLVLQELIHGPLDAAGRDRSFELLLRSARLLISQPQRVLFLMGNHDLAQATGGEISKEGRNTCKDFEAAVCKDYGADGAEILRASYDFLLAMPIAIRCPNKVLLSHSLPSPNRMRFAGVEFFGRPLTQQDLLRGGPVYEWTWGRGQTPEQTELLAAQLDVELFILGHRHTPDGFEKITPRAVTIASDHDYGCVVRFRTDEPLTMDTLPQHVLPLAGLI